ncbi:hypothetical protein CH371_20260, partial [Leptospira wolffii]
TLFMKICDITAGCSPVGSAPTAVNTVASAPITGVFDAKVYNGRIVFIWESNDKIYIRAYDLTTSTFINSGAELLVGSRVTYGSFSDISLALSNGRAMVVWNDITYTPIDGTAYTNGRIFQIDGSTITAVGPAFSVYVAGAVNGAQISRVQASASGTGKVLISFWNSYSNLLDSFFQHRYIIYDLTTGLPTTGSIGLFSAHGGVHNNAGTLKVHTTQDRGVVIAQASSNIGIAYGINLETGALLTGGAQAFDSSGIGSYKSTLVNDSVYISFSIGKNIFFRVFQMNEGLFKYSSKIQVNSTGATATSRQPGQTTYYNNNVVTLWEHTENGLTTIRGRMIDIGSQYN